VLLNRGQVALREESKIEGEEIYLGEELGRKKLKNKHSRILCKINAK